MMTELIAASYSDGEARMAEARRATAEEKHLAASIGAEVLRNIPKIAGACAHLSAVWCQLIRQRTDLPCFQVAGALYARGCCVFGKTSTNRKARFAFRGSNLDWDGHCWIWVAGLIGDASVFRTAYSETAPPVLTDAVIEAFGKGRGLILSTAADLASSGLDYRPLYVLTNKEVDGLWLGARQLFTSS
jgi:hypothetical protein